jgi:hypothetical protein
MAQQPLPASPATIKPAPLHTDGSLLLQRKATITIAACPERPSIPGCDWRRVGEERPNSAAWTKTKEPGVRLVAAQRCRTAAAATAPYLVQRGQAHTQYGLKTDVGSGGHLSVRMPLVAVAACRRRRRCYCCCCLPAAAAACLRAEEAAALCFNAARAAAFSSRRCASLKSSSSNGGGGYIGGASSLDTR